jgi:hypothetical protein
MGADVCIYKWKQYNWKSFTKFKTLTTQSYRELEFGITTLYLNFELLSLNLQHYLHLKSIHIWMILSEDVSMLDNTFLNQKKKKKCILKYINKHTHKKNLSNYHPSAHFLNVISFFFSLRSMICLLYIYPRYP